MLAATVGSELDASAGPRITPSAAMAVRAPPETSAATGGCSTTVTCSVCGNEALAWSSRTTGKPATAARSADCLTSSVLMPWPARSSADLIALASRPLTPLRRMCCTETSDEWRSHTHPPPSRGAQTSVTSAAMRSRRRAHTA